MFLRRYATAPLALLLVLVLVSAHALNSAAQQSRPSDRGISRGQVSRTFPIGVFDDANMQSPKTFAAMIRDVKRRGLNAIMLTNGDAAGLDALLSVSDRAGGVKVYLGPFGDLNEEWWPAGVPANLATARKVIDPLVARLKRHRSLAGYYIADEPSLDQQTKVALAEQAFHEADPSRPAMPDLIGVDRIPPIFDAAKPDVLLMDVYPFAYHNGPCDTTMNAYGYPMFSFSSYVDLGRQVKPAGVPLWLILQTHNFGTQLREPSPAEVREETWLSIAGGATGLFYFIYSSQQGWTGLHDNHRLFAVVTGLGHEIRRLSGLLLRLHPGADEFAVNGGQDALVSTLLSANGKTSYAVVVNQSCQAQDVQIRPMGTSGGTFRNLVNGARYRPGQSIRFGPGDGALFAYSVRRGPHGALQTNR